RGVLLLLHPFPTRRSSDLIFAFLEEGTSILTREGAFLAVMMAFTVGLVSFSGDIARRIAGRIWHSDSRFQLYPINLGIAVVTVADRKSTRLNSSHVKISYA